MGGIVGVEEGLTVLGVEVGDKVGSAEGTVLGEEVGVTVGSAEGTELGERVGDEVGTAVGSADGIALGFEVVGENDGFAVGIMVGAAVGRGQCLKVSNAGWQESSALVENSAQTRLHMIFFK